MIKNNKAFSMIEMMVTLAVLGAVMLMMPNFFIANVSMNKYFDVQNLLSRTRNLTLQNLQNKNTVIRIMYDLHGPAIVPCLQEINPSSECASFNMTERKKLVPASSTLTARPDLAILNSKHSLAATCEDNCLISISTEYKLNCRLRSCDSVEFLVKTEKIKNDKEDPAAQHITDTKDFVLLSKNDLKKVISEDMACTNPNLNFLFAFNYVTRNGTCNNCQPLAGATPGSSCFSPGSSTKNSGVIKAGLNINPKSIALDAEIPEKIAVKFDLQQATNGVFGRVDISCVAGGTATPLPASTQSMMMSSLNGSNKYQGTWNLDSSSIKSGPSSYSLNCTLKAYDSQGLGIVAMAAASLIVYPTTAGQQGGDVGLAPPDGSPGPGGGPVGGGFTAPSYSAP